LSIIANGSGSPCGGGGGGGGGGGAAAGPLAAGARAAGIDRVGAPAAAAAERLLVRGALPGTGGKPAAAPSAFATPGAPGTVITDPHLHLAFFPASSGFHLNPLPQAEQVNS
jgi:hypothetical protein